MKDIKGYNTFTKIEPITKGWSDDKKYYIVLQLQTNNKYDKLYKK